MRNNPFLIGLLIGLIVILLIGGVSLLVEMNNLRGNYKKENAKKMVLEKAIEELKEEKGSLESAIDTLNTQLANTAAEFKSQIEELNLENLKLEKLKDKLEESLKDELMKGELGQR